MVWLEPKLIDQLPYWATVCVFLCFGPNLFSPVIRRINSIELVELFSAIGFLTVAIAFVTLIVTSGQHEAGSFYYVLSLLLIVLISFTVSILPLLHRREKDLKARKAYDDLLNSERDPARPLILFLRPFDLDGRITRHISTNDKLPPSVGPAQGELDFEDHMVSCGELFGDVVSLGKSLRIGERLGAAARFETTDENWKSIVSAFLDEADIILLLPSTNPGTQWEMDQIFRRKLLSRTLILHWPPVNVLIGKNLTALLNWPHVIGFWGVRGRDLPHDAMNGAAYYFEGDNKDPEVFEPIFPRYLNSIVPDRSAPLCKGISKILELQKSEAV